MRRVVSHLRGDAVRELPLSDFGLMTVAQACEAKGWTPTTVSRWVRAGLIPAVVIGTGKGALFLLRRSDVAEFTPPARGRPTGSQDSYQRERSAPDAPAERERKK